MRYKWLWFFVIFLFTYILSLCYFFNLDYSNVSYGTSLIILFLSFALTLVLGILMLLTADKAIITQNCYLAGINTALFIIYDILNPKAAGLPNDGFVSGLILMHSLYVCVTVIYCCTDKNRSSLNYNIICCFGSFSSLIIGWFLAVVIWSTFIPDKIISNAQKVANGKAYCILTYWDEPKVKSDLSALNAYLNKKANSFDYHAFLIIENSEIERVFYNWSYRQNSFQLHERSTEYYSWNKGKKLCTAKIDFAKNLPKY